MMSLSLADKLDQGDQDLKGSSQQFHLASLMTQLIDDMMPFASAYGVNLSLELSPRTLNTFTGDPSNIARAAICVLRHAIGRVPGGRVKAKVLIDNIGHTMRFEVCDNGPAYHEDDVFSLKGQSQFSPSILQTGTDIFGLNLPIACRIASYLGGTLNLKHDFIAGGLVRIDLPLVVADPQLRLPVRSDTNPKPLRILCVDHDRSSQQALRAILETLGYDPDLAFSYVEAEETLHAHAFDLIVIAQSQEMVNGKATATVVDMLDGILRVQTPQRPMIALLLDVDAPDDRTISHKAPDAILRKPINLVALLNLLNVCTQSPLLEDPACEMVLDPAA